MNWCTIHKTEFKYCEERHKAQVTVSQPVAQMSFGDFERVMSIIEKATEKDIRDIVEMLDQRRRVMKMLKEKKEATGNA